MKIQLGDILDSYLKTEIGIEHMMRKRDDRQRETDRVLIKLKDQRSLCNLMRRRELKFNGNGNIGIKAKLSIWLRYSKLCNACQQLNHMKNECPNRDKRGEPIDVCGRCNRNKHADRCKQSDRFCRLC